MKRSLFWMGVVFLALAAVIALTRKRDDDGGAASTDAKADTIRSFWEAYNRATGARIAGNYGAAASAYREALAIDASHQDSLFYLAVSLESTGDYREAAGVLRQLTRTYPEHSRGWTQLGALMARHAPGVPRDLDAAEAAFRRSEEINQEHTGPFLKLGLVALERRQYDEAARLFGIAADAGSPEGLFLAGLTAYHRADFPLAARSFARVLENSAREAAITGRGASAEGDIHGAMSALDRARIRARWFLYWTASRMGGYPEAVPDPFRMEPAPAEVAFELVRPVDGDGGGAFIDANGDGRAELVVAGAEGARFPLEPALRLSKRSSWDVVPLDVDSDGWMDLYVVGSGYVGTAANELYRNDRGRFIEVTETWGLDGARPTARAIPADLDGDGSVDVLEVGAVSSDWPAVRLFRQRSNRFELAELAPSYRAHAVDAAVADVDGDGRLDVFVLGWKAPGSLFRNTGTAFEDVTDSAGLGQVGGDGYSVVFFDADADADADLLVTSHAPLELSLLRASHGPTPRLFRNDGRGRFVEDTAGSGLDRSFGVVQALAADLDDDGLQDLIFAHGGLDATHLEPSVVLRNRDGRTFVPWAYLPSADEPRRALGVAVGDVDGDAVVFLSGVGLLRRPSR